MADLTIVVDVHEIAPGKDQTMSSYSIPPSGKLVFKNAAAPNKGDLVITPKSPTTEFPFCKSNGTDRESLPPIAPGDSATVHICNGSGDDFYYTAQIGTAEPEDPIVIIEKKLNFALDPWAAGFFGAVVGAGIAYVILKSRMNKNRPQQG